MNDEAGLLDVLRAAASLIAVAAGLGLMASALTRIVGAGDAFRRLHAAVAGQGFAFGLIAFGLALADGRFAAFVGAAAATALIGCAGAVRAHAGANAAHAAGLEPGAPPANPPAGPSQ
jgi:multisubunit Na+/H+ antiporter MnhG subunit